MKLDLVEMSRAFFRAEAIREVQLQLPAEDTVPRMCWRQEKAMHGTRDALKLGASTHSVQDWEEDKYYQFTLRQNSDAWCKGMLLQLLPGRKQSSVSGKRSVRRSSHSTLDLRTTTQRKRESSIESSH